MKSTRAPHYARHRFPADVISHAVWLSFRFPLSLRMVEEMLKKQGVAPRVMITDKLASYGAAKRGMMPSVEHRQHKGLNNRAENSHQTTRRRERIMKRFKSAGQAQRFLWVQDQVANLFRHPANTNAADRRQAQARAFTAWAEVTGITVGF